MPEKKIFTINIKNFYFGDKECFEIPLEIEKRCFPELNIRKPVSGVMILTRQGEDIKAEIEVTAFFEDVCERCLDDLIRKQSLTFNRLFTKNPERKYVDSETLAFLSDFKIDIGKEIQEEFILQKPFKILCQNNCLGLCKKCGANLNINKHHKC